MVKQETDKFKRFWIWFWYNDYTRIFWVLLPIPSIIIITLLMYIGLPGQYAADLLITTYLGLLIWGIYDNDFSKLERIGRNVDGKLIDK
ncbi:MAG: hypothetical protein PHC28_15845 [Flavobacterium sp.]|uniref:hypothetical protein n=1 Tax=Flavobacterium sp. TaxID=239 RepID=UPI0026077171|nr:hypothetical protein [Flavobacterium sp.]MDD5151925.1 hypothetical protein [Flavobacterium sp.]